MSDEGIIEYTIRLTPLALDMLAAVKDRREQEKLGERINQLKIEPEKQGKALVDNLSGFRSVRAVGQRYRIVYIVLSIKLSVSKFSFSWLEWADARMETKRTSTQC